MLIYPLSVRDKKPHVHATKIKGTRADGLPDGVHTGGCYLIDGEVWKPLDGRPYLNADHHAATLEAECLEANSDLPFFPKNWRIEERNERRWLVRNEAYIVGKEHGKKIDFNEIDKDTIMLLEQTVRELNRRGWEINDPISLGFDVENSVWFIVDLSSCNKLPDDSPYHCDEEYRIYQFMEWCGYDKLVAFRKKGRTMLHDWVYSADEIELKIERLFKYENVYASFNRPFSLVWATLPNETKLIHEDKADWKRSIPWTWILTVEPLPDDVQKRYELRWAWSPINVYKDKRRKK